MACTTASRTARRDSLRDLLQGVRVAGGASRGCRDAVVHAPSACAAHHRRCRSVGVGAACSNATCTRSVALCGIDIAVQCRLAAARSPERRLPLDRGDDVGSCCEVDGRTVTGRVTSLRNPSGNSIEHTATRDHACDFVFRCAMIAQHLSRWAEQWIIYMTTEFGFIKIADRYTTSSSMMPQKRNPDMLELIRGRCGNVYGDLFALMTILKGLPIGYNRDLQEDKRIVFRAYDTVSSCLTMAAAIVSSANFVQGEHRADAGARVPRCDQSRGVFRHQGHPVPHGAPDRRHAGRAAASRRARRRCAAAARSVPGSQSKAHGSHVRRDRERTCTTRSAHGTSSTATAAPAPRGANRSSSSSRSGRSGWGWSDRDCWNDRTSRAPRTPSSRGRLADRGISGWSDASFLPEIPQVGKPPIGMTVCDCKTCRRVCD